MLSFAASPWPLGRCFSSRPRSSLGAYACTCTSCAFRYVWKLAVTGCGSSRPLWQRAHSTAAAAAPLLTASTHGLQSTILNLATSTPAVPGQRDLFLAQIRRLAKYCVAYVVVNWLSGVALQIYLERAMLQLYTGLFQHVLFQDSPFYDRISPSELAM